MITTSRIDPILQTGQTETEKPSVKHMCTFLAEYSAILFGAGATCIRLEKNVTRIAGHYDMDIEMSIFPRHIHLTVYDRNNHETVTSISSIRDCGINFTYNARLSRLSWDIADSNISLAEAERAYSDILRSTVIGKWTLLILVSTANAAFCRLFGGDAAAMTIVFMATLAGFATKQMLTEKHTDFRITTIVSAFISAILAAAGFLFSIGNTPDVAIGTSVLYLVPGIPYINSFCDMLDRHYICAFGRLMNAFVITACLSIGLCAGMMLMRIGMF